MHADTVIDGLTTEGEPDADVMWQTFEKTQVRAASTVDW